MAAQTINLSLQFPENNRFNVANKDAKIINAYVEAGGEEFNWTIKRPGFNVLWTFESVEPETELDPEVPPRGLFRLGEDIISVFGPFVFKNEDEIYELEDNSEGTVYFSQLADEKWLLKTNQSLFIVDDEDNFDEVDDGDYPSPTLPGIVVINGTAHVLNDESEIYSSDSDNITSWDALNFLTAEAEPDTPIAIHKQRDLIIAFGSRSIEFFFDSGQEPPGSPLSPQRNSFMSIGCPAADSIADSENITIFVAEDQEGQRFVATLAAAQLQRVSTVSEDRVLSEEENISEANAYVAEASGHKFYILQLSSQTLVYDMVEGMWYTWSTECENLLGRHAVKLGSRTLVQDDLVIYEFSPQYGHDAQKPIQMTIVTPTWGGQGVQSDFASLNKFLSRLEVVGDFTGEGKLWISWSDDDYKTWSRPRCIDLHKRDFLTRCGRFQRRAFRLQTEFPNRLRIRNLELRVEAGRYGK